MIRNIKHSKEEPFSPQDREDLLKQELALNLSRQSLLQKKMALNQEKWKTLKDPLKGLLKIEMDQDAILHDELIREEEELKQKLHEK